MYHILYCEIYLHLYKNKQNINPNYILKYRHLEKIVSCLASTCFYDITDFKDRRDGQLNVIVFNEQFEIIEELKTIFNFEEYK